MSPATATNPTACPHRPEGGRYPFAPLSALLPRNRDARASKLRVSRATLRRYETEGLDGYQADRCAVRAGHHPGTVWPEWWTTHHGADQ